MRTAQAIELLTAAIKARHNVLLVGAPGIGKTDLQATAAQRAKALNFVFHPSISDPTDAKGFPMIIDGVPQFVAFDELQRVYDAIEQDLPCTVFYDDLGQAMQATQASHMALMDRLKGKCAVIAATNRRTDRAGVSGLLEPVKSRFTTIVEIEAHIDDWSSWAIDNGIQPELIAYLRNRPDYLHKFEATADLVNQPCPRTWHAVSKLLRLNLSSAVELMTLQGAVGNDAAADFLAFLRVWRDMPDLDEVLMNPAQAAIPSAANILYAISTGLASKVNVQVFPAIVTYAERLFKAGHEVFAVLLIRDCVQRDKAVCKTETFIKRIASSELGKMIRGEL